MKATPSELAVQDSEASKEEVGIAGNNMCPRAMAQRETSEIQSILEAVQRD